jgi:signal transduction histidine kinase
MHQGWLTFSLRRQIVLSLSLTALATIALICGWFYWQFETATSDLRNSTLVSRTDMIVQHLTVAPDGGIDFSPPSVLARAYGGHGEHHRYSVRDEQGLALFGNAEHPTGRAPPMVSEQEDGTLYHYRDMSMTPPTHMVGVARLVQLGGRRLLIQVEEAAPDRLVQARALVEVSLERGGWMMLPLVLVPLGVSLIIIRRTLAPITALSATAAAIGPTSTDVRLSEQGVPVEVLPLVRAINQALDRLEDGFRIQREFTAGAAHELRTPLAVLTAHVDNLPCQETARALHRDIDAMTHVTNQLLRVAQVEALVLDEAEQADLTAIAGEVAGHLAPLAVRKGKAIELEADAGSVTVNGSSEAIEHALRNLAHNALIHTAPGSVVTVSVGVEGGTPVVAVRDHGPGVPVALRARVFERFWRADRRSNGAGLGLAIVKRVMELHGGRVDVDDAPGGGALFILRFTAVKRTAADDA